MEKIDTNKLPQKYTLSLFQPTISAFFLIPILILSFNLHRIETNTLLVKSYADPSNSANKPIVVKYANQVINNSLADPFYKLMVSLYMVDMGEIESSYLVVSNLHHKDPINLEYLRWLIEYERSKKNFVKEIVYREKIVKLDPWNAVNYYELGKLFQLQGDRISTLKMREKILSFASNTKIGNLAKVELN